MVGRDAEKAAPVAVEVAEEVADEATPVGGDGYLKPRLQFFLHKS